MKVIVIQQFAYIHMISSNLRGAYKHLQYLKSIEWIRDLKSYCQYSRDLKKKNKISIESETGAEFIVRYYHLNRATHKLKKSMSL